MRYALRSVSVAVLVAFALVGCATMTGKTTGENVDDASITMAVKTKLASEKLVTLTKIDVGTNRGTVYLTGNVEDESMRYRAADLARQVNGVKEVVNNLKIQQTGS